MEQTFKSRARVLPLLSLCTDIHSYRKVWRQVRRGMLVYDPFVGTGSILIAAAHMAP